MNSVKVRNITIGEGTPKICVPIVGVTKEEILEVYEILKKNQYGQYLKDVLDGKYRENLY